MTSFSEKALLPPGLRDVLPPVAAFEAETIQCLMAAFRAQGYERVEPPLVEFEESLFSGSGAATQRETFRLMDPASQRMLGLRPDMTTQVARIATSRLSGRERPLRLAYAGQVLRVRGGQPRNRRQFVQVGAELIGTKAAAGDVEVILLAAGALRSRGVEGLSVDLGMPTLVPALCRQLGLAAEAQTRLRQALDRKDAAAVAQV